jgi:hypothetical protein
MAAEVFTATHAFNNGPLPAPIGDRRPLEKNGKFAFSFAETEPSQALPAIILRKLPSNSDRDAVRNILLFAKDLVDCELVPTLKYPEDKGFACAIARFRTMQGAKEAQALLDGRLNATNDAHLIVELMQDGPSGAVGTRRNTVDSASNRQGSVSTASSIGGPTTNGRQSSRYNGTFQQQSFDKISPPNMTPGLGNGEFAAQSVFSPTSPVTQSFVPRNNLGKSVINDEADDDGDTLLNDTFNYGAGQSLPRRTTNPSIPVSRFSSLSLNTNGVAQMSPPPMPSYTSPRSAATMQSPGTTLSAMSPHAMSPAMNGHGPNPGYSQYNQHFPRHNYPPVNPADQNPPCNTLYVGNLPIDTSEDELKAMFSKQRGYKRLCFRTKQNGPMCFVEFEDISFATKALNDLYGHMLHNSVKGGIRLSFSKNPLGVRTGQSGTMGPASSVTPTTPMGGFGANVAAQPGMPFSAATGPPPGLSAPPGLSTPAYPNGSSGFGMYSNGGGFGMGPNDGPGGVRSQPVTANPVSGNGFGGMNGSYYMMGR